MIEGALTSLMNSILTGAALTSAGKGMNKKEAPKVIESEDDKPKEKKAEIRKLTKDELDELEYLLLAGGLDTKQVKSVLSGDVVPRKWFKDFDRDILKQIASITGEKYYENIVYGDGGKLGKGYTTIPLSKRAEPKTETMPLGESEGKKGTTIEGEEAKNKDTVMKGEEAKSKGTVMEIPEEDLSRLIEMIGYNSPDWNSPKLAEFAMKKGMHLRDVVKQVQAEWNRKYQKQLENDLKKQTQKDGVVKYDKKINSPQYKAEHEKAAEKYKAETPDYKWEDVKKKNEAEGKKYDGRRHSNESYSSVQRAEDYADATGSKDWVKRHKRITAPGEPPKLD